MHSQNRKERAVAFQWVQEISLANQTYEPNSYDSDLNALMSMYQDFQT